MTALDVRAAVHASWTGGESPITHERRVCSALGELLPVPRELVERLPRWAPWLRWGAAALVAALETYYGATCAGLSDPGV